jgi:RNA recognition motif-containing protein
MNNKLFVGNLPFSLTDTELQNIFESHGSVKSAIVISDRATGHSRGYGFVEMESEEAAHKAVEILNETRLQGRVLIVEGVHPRQGRGPELSTR